MGNRNNIKANALLVSLRSYFTLLPIQYTIAKTKISSYVHLCIFMHVLYLIKYSFIIDYIIMYVHLYVAT